MNKFPHISNEFPLILASESPRRKELLEQIRLPFKTLPSNIDEDSIKLPPSAMAKALAEKKASAVREKAGGKWILGADTIVVSVDRILGKPSNHDEARSMLTILSGRDHEVITGYSILYPSGDVAHTEHVTTTVSVKALSSKEIDAYISTKEPFGKAGSYAIQGVGSFMVEGITGSYSNVVGLPLCDVIKSLLDVGAIAEFPSRLLP